MAKYTVTETYTYQVDADTPEDATDKAGWFSHDSHDMYATLNEEQESVKPKTYIIGPGGLYMPIEDAFIVKVHARAVSGFELAMNEEDVDLAWEFVYDSVPGHDVDTYIPWGDETAEERNS